MQVFHAESKMLGHLKNGEPIAITIENFSPEGCPNQFTFTISHSGESVRKYTIDELLEKLGLKFEPKSKEETTNDNEGIRDDRQPT